MVVEVAHAAHCRLVAYTRQRRADRIERGSRGARRVLRVQRQNQDAVAALLLHVVERGRHRRRAVAHRVFDDQRCFYPLAKVAAQHPRLAFGVRAQGRAVRAPDLRVALSRALGPERQDDQIQYQPPQRPRNFDHARIGQEFTQVTAHRRRGRRIGRAEVDQQDAALRRAAVSVGGFGEVTRHGALALRGERRETRGDRENVRRFFSARLSPLVFRFPGASHATARCSAALR